MTVYSENCMKSTDALCGQNAKQLIIREHNTYSSHSALKD